MSDGNTIGTNLQVEAWKHETLMLLRIARCYTPHAESTSGGGGFNVDLSRETSGVSEPPR